MTAYSNLVASLEGAYMPKWSADAFMVGLLEMSELGRTPIVDLGCGDATLAERLSTAHCTRYVGVDIKQDRRVSKMGALGVPIDLFPSLPGATAAIPELRRRFAVVSSFSCHEFGAENFVRLLPKAADSLFAIDLTSADLPKLYSAIRASGVTGSRPDPRNALRDVWDILAGRGWMQLASGTVNLAMVLSAPAWRSYCDLFGVAQGDDSGLTISATRLDRIVRRLFELDGSDTRDFWWCHMQRKPS